MGDLMQQMVGGCAQSYDLSHGMICMESSTFPMVKSFADTLQARRSRHLSTLCVELEASLLLLRQLHTQKLKTRISRGYR